MKAFFLSLILITSFAFSLDAQNSWSRYLENEDQCGTCYFVDMKKVQNGVIILMGNTDFLTDTTSWLTFALLKYSFQGDLLWHQKYDLTNVEPFGWARGSSGEEIIPLSDGEFLIRGTKILDSSEKFLAAFDADGNLKTSRTFPEYDLLRSIQQFEEIAFIGEFPDASSEIVLLNPDDLSTVGILPLQYTFVYDMYLRADAIYINGYSDDLIQGVFRLNWQGEREAIAKNNAWEFLRSGPERILTYKNDSVWTYDHWLNEINYELVKNYTPFGGSIYNATINDKISLQGWGTAFAGHVGSYFTIPFILELNQNGEEVFYQIYDSSYLPNDAIRAIQWVHDGYIIVVGDADVTQEEWLLRINKEGLLSTKSTEYQTEALQAFPNPMTDHFQINFQEANTWQIQLFNLQGSLVMEDSANSTSYRSPSLHFLPSGAYTLIGISDSGRIFNQMLFKE